MHISEPLISMGKTLLGLVASGFIYNRIWAFIDRKKNWIKTNGIKGEAVILETNFLNVSRSVGTYKEHKLEIKLLITQPETRKGEVTIQQYFTTRDMPNVQKTVPIFIHPEDSKNIIIGDIDDKPGYKIWRIGKFKIPYRVTTYKSKDGESFSKWIEF